MKIYITTEHEDQTYALGFDHDPLADDQKKFCIHLAWLTKACLVNYSSLTGEELKFSINLEVITLGG